MATDVTGSFELRKVLIRWSRAPAGGTVEDAAYIHFHLLQLISGAPAARWNAADYAACESALGSWWAAVKSDYPSWLNLAEYRWYKSGPAVEPEGGGVFNPSVRSTTVNTPGSGTTVTYGALPPQLAFTHTFITSVRKRWGRVYLPAFCTYPGIGITTGDGRVQAARVNELHPNMVTLLNAFRSAGFRPVVWSRAKSAYVTRAGNSIGAHDATAYEITSVQTDNLFDVIRSRRWVAPTQRNLTALT